MYSLPSPLEPRTGLEWKRFSEWVKKKKTLEVGAGYREPYQRVHACGKRGEYECDGHRILKYRTERIA